MSVQNFLLGRQWLLPFIFRHLPPQVLEEILQGSLIWKARQDSLWQPLLRPLLFLPAVRVVAFLVWPSSGAELCAVSLGHKSTVRSLCCFRRELCRVSSTYSWRRSLASWCDYCVLEEPCIPPAGKLGAGSEQTMLQGGQTAQELWQGSRPSMGSLDFPTLPNPPKSVPDNCLPMSIRPMQWVQVQFRSKTNLLWSNNGQVGALSLKYDVSLQAVGGVALE